MTKVTFITKLKHWGAGCPPHEFPFPLLKNTNRNLSTFATTFVVKRRGHPLLRENCMEQYKNNFQKSILYGW